MKLIIKNSTEFCNILYGDNQDYSDIDIKEILKEKIEHLLNIYNNIDEDAVGVEELYSLGDIINLLKKLLRSIEIKEGRK